MNSDFTPGQTITVQKTASRWHCLDGSGVCVTPPPYMAKILVVTERSILICEGHTKQAQMAPWVQDACQEAGIDPAQKIQLVLFQEAKVGEKLMNDAQDYKNRWQQVLDQLKG